MQNGRDTKSESPVNFSQKSLISNRFSAIYKEIEVESTFAMFEKKISEEISELQSLALLIVRPGQLCGEIDWKMPFQELYFYILGIKLWGNIEPILKRL